MAFKVNGRKENPIQNMFMLVEEIKPRTRGILPEKEPDINFKYIKNRLILLSDEWRS